MTLVLAFVAGALAGAAGKQLLSYYRAAASTFHARTGPQKPPAALGALPGFADFTLRTARGLGIRAWYVPSRNRAAIVFLHGSRGTRTALVPEAAALARQGFGVLLFDFPGHGESEGAVHWDADDRASLTAAIDHLSRCADVDPQRIGVYAFSMGGVIAAQVVPDEPRVAALVLAAVPTNMREVLRWQYRGRGPAQYLPAWFAYHRGGVPLSFDVRAAVRRLAGRPLLVVSGDEDAVVPFSMARELHAAAGAEVVFHTVSGAGHGGYLALEPSFSTVLRDFFDRSLRS